MRLTPTPGSIAGRRADRAGDPLDGLINLFDLSLVLAVGLLLAALSSIGATQLIVPQGPSGTPLQGQPPSSGQNGQGQGKEVGKVYRLNDGRYVFAPSAGSTKSGGATGATGGATGVTGGATGPTGATAAIAPGGTSSLPPASTTTQPATPLPTN